MPQEPTNLLVLPYFSPSGTPYFDSAVKGAVIGLDLSTRRADILKALLEGVALEMRVNLEILEESGYQVNELRMIGGGAKSQIWNQLRADVIGKPITVINVTEAGCKGAAMLAAAAFTKKPLAVIADDWTKIIDRINPDPARSYDQKFTSYKEFYPIIKSLM